MKVVEINGKKIYVNDQKVDEKETDISISAYEKKNLEENTIEFSPISEEELLEDTLTNLWDDKDE